MRPLLRKRKQRGLLLASATGGGGGGSGFSIASTPATSTATKIPYAPSLTAGPTGLDQYRPWRDVVIDGELFITNGWDTARRWDKTNNIWALAGSTAPATFALALSAAGAPAAIPTGQTARYYLVGLNSTLDKETAPQGGTELTIANASGATRDVTITWTASEFAADMDKIRVYRALNATDDFKKVADVAVATGTYLDVTPDASLFTATSWNGATRTTLPPKFAGWFESQGRIIAFEKSGDFIRYGREVRVTGTFRADDFPEENVLQIGADEGTGPVTAGTTYLRSNILWKRRAIYEMTGSDISTWEVRGLMTSRGTFNVKTVVQVDKFFICLDEVGVYKFTPGMYAGVAGSVEETYHAPMQPIFDRMNLSAGNLFHATHLTEDGIVIFWVALDHEPVPNTGIVFNYAEGKFDGIVTRRHPSAAGLVADVNGVVHQCFGDDMGYIWEDRYAESEGCFSGSNTSTVTSASDTARTVTSSGASYTTTLQGPLGTPLDRYNSSGTLIDENRVYAVTSTVITTYLYPSAAASAGDAVAVGVIPGVFETGKLSFGTHDMKLVRTTYVEYTPGVSGSVRFDTELDDEGFNRKVEHSFASGVRTYIPEASTTDRKVGYCWTWRIRVSQRYANLGFSIRALHVHYDRVPGQLQS